MIDNMDWKPEPPMDERELVDAKWGKTNPTQRELAEAALYWFDQAYSWRLAATERLAVIEGRA